MKNKFDCRILILLSLLATVTVILWSVPQNAQAQTGDSTTDQVNEVSEEQTDEETTLDEGETEQEQTGEPVPDQAIRVVQSQQGDQNTLEINLAGLGYPSRVLRGPSDSTRYGFTIPPNWALQNGSYLELDLEYSVRQDIPPVPGLLEVTLNGTVLYTASFTDATVISPRIEIPTNTLKSAEDVSGNALDIELLIPVGCEEHQQPTLTIQNSSLFNFVYQERPLFLDLALYPSPFYHGYAFEPTTVRMLLSSQPDDLELESAATIAANLGALTNNNLPVEVNLDTTLPLTPTQDHLIAVGTPEQLPFLTELDLPLPVRQRRLSISSQMPASVALGQPFDYTLIVENTSNTTQNLIVEDRVSPALSIRDCPGCSEVISNTFRWNIEALEPGETVSTTIQAIVSETFGLNEVIEHTASLLDSDEQVINVDTLTSPVTLETNGVVSSQDKDDYFFALDNRGVAETDGLIQLISAPLNEQRAMLIVTGLNNEAVSRAAQALSTQDGVLDMNGQFAIIQSIRPITTTPASPIQNMTLAELGYTNDIVRKGRAGDIRVNFNLPRDAVIESAQVMLHLSHGVAFKAISATLEISLNGLPFGSLELSEDSTESSFNISLPASRLRGGDNQLVLSIVADWPACMDADDRERLWITLYTDTVFNLLYTRREGPLPLDLQEYPTFLIVDQSALQDVLFSLPEPATPAEIQGLMRIMSSLGQNLPGTRFTPRIITDSEARPEQWQDYHMIAIGRPTRNPYIQAANNELPQPFIPGQDEIRQQIDDVVYRLSPNYDLGYIQLLRAPWNRTRVFLATTGTTDTGLQWALQVLASDLRRQMWGNLAVIPNAGEVRSTDTREPTSGEDEILSSDSLPLLAEATVTPAPTSEPTVEPTVAPPSTSVPLSAANLSPREKPPLWQIGLLIFSVLILALALGVYIGEKYIKSRRYIPPWF